MKREVRAPVIRLLTVPQAADQLGVTRSDIDRLVATGGLQSVSVSPHGGRRFWPADVQTWATARTETDPAAADVLGEDLGVDPAVAPSAATAPRHRGRTQRELAPKHPRWARFEPVRERAPSSYLAFRDAEHVTSYLRARATLDEAAPGSVHPRQSDSAKLLVPS